ncbi:phosphotransferase [Schaalia sp. 19OD2882]|uniref:phosphotransferase n=1 Tax=Schaalia sp. 19OD2882 TaxID=2794089 RepID=UPI0020A7D66F|nr:phosphotransferase [Schaalia sp. 19OD2882]
MAILEQLPGVRRAWPGSDGSLVWEGIDEDGLLRAGRIDSQGRVHRQPHGVDPAVPSPPAGLQATLVVHRLGRRAVRIWSDGVVKSVRPGRADALADAMEAFRTHATDALKVPALIDHDHAHLFTRRAPGAELRRSGAEGVDGWRTLMEEWPLVFRSTDDDRLPLHEGADEARVLRHWLEQVRVHGLIDPHAHVETRIRRLGELLTRAGSRRVLAHRDLHDGQILWDGEKVWLIDLDTACRAAPEVDLANLRAHAEVSHLCGRSDARVHGAILDGLDDLATRLDLRSADMDAYLEAARLRIALVHAFRPSDASWLPAWVDHCLRHTGIRSWTHASTQGE